MRAHPRIDGFDGEEEVGVNPTPKTFMKPYGKHSAFKGCECIYCGRKRKLRQPKKKARQVAKKEISREIE